MGADSTIAKSKEFVALLWSIALLILFLYVAYEVIKNYRKDRIKTRNTTSRKKKRPSKKKREEETSLMQYPDYELDVPAHDFKLNKSGIVEAVELYTYEDLLDVTTRKDKKFFEEYLASVKSCLSDKEIKYTKLLEEKRGEDDDISGVSSNDGAPSGYSPDKTCKIIEQILEQIEYEKENTTIDTLKANFKKILWHKEKGLDTLIGRKDIKDFIAAQIFAFKRHPKHSYTGYQNALILGDSGMGKSKIGITIAHALSLSSIIVREKVSRVAKDRFVSPYVNATGAISREFLEENLEAIIIFEEIYDITPPKGLLGDENRDHGREALNVIVDFTERFKGLSRIYAIGYKKPTIEQFLKPNEGMERRFPNIIELTPYSDSELTRILARFLGSDAGINLSEDEVGALYSMIVKAKEINPKIFSKSAGDMENLCRDISTVIYTMKDAKWIPEDTENNKALLLRGFNTYLQKKVGISLSE